MEPDLDMKKCCHLVDISCNYNLSTACLLAPPINNGASLVAQRVKRLPAMRETQVRSLGQEDPLEKEMATHSGILAWKIPWTEKPGRLHVVTKSRRRLGDFTSTFQLTMPLGLLMTPALRKGPWTPTAEINSEDN